MKVSFLSGIPAIVLLAAPVFGIGPGDHVWPVQTTVGEPESGHVLRGATPERPSLFGLRLGDVPDLGAEGTNDCFGPLSDEWRLNWISSLFPADGRKFSLRPKEPFDDARFTSASVVIDPVSGEVVFVSGHVDTWNLHTPVPEVYHSLARDLFNRFGACETVLDDICTQAGWVWRVTFFPTERSGIAFCCHEQFGIDLALFSMPLDSSRARGYPPWEPPRHVFEVAVDPMSGKGETGAHPPPAHPARRLFEENAGRRPDPRRIISEAFSLDVDNLGTNRWVVPESFANAGSEGLFVKGRWCLALWDAPPVWKPGDAHRVWHGKVAFLYQRPVSYPGTHPAFARVSVDQEWLTVFESPEAARSGLCAFLAGLAVPVSSVIRQTERIQIRDGVCLSVGMGPRFKYIFAKDNLVMEMTRVRFNPGTDDRFDAVPADFVFEALGRVLETDPPEIGMVAENQPRLVKTRDAAAVFVGRFRLNPDTPVTSNVAGNTPDVWPVSVLTNGVFIEMQKDRTGESGRVFDGDEVSVLLNPTPDRSTINGRAFLFPTPTNTLARLLEPLVETTGLSPDSLAQSFRYEPGVGSACFVSRNLTTESPVQETPRQVFLVKGGVSCYLKGTAVTNLVEMAEIVCDTLSPRAEGGAP